MKRGREETVTNDSVVEVVRQHPLTHSHQQPEGFLLLSVQQQNGGQDVHGLLRGFTGERTITDQVTRTTETFNNTQAQVIHRSPDHTDERCSIPSQSRLSWSNHSYLRGPHKTHWAESSATTSSLAPGSDARLGCGARLRLRTQPHQSLCLCSDLKIILMTSVRFRGRTCHSGFINTILRWRLGGHEGQVAS